MFDISKYITSDWNEEHNPNMYAPDVGKRVWRNLIAGMKIGYFTEPGSATKTKTTINLSANADNVLSGTFSYRSGTKNVSGTVTGAVKHLKDSSTGAITGISVDFTRTTTAGDGSSGSGVWKSHKESKLMGVWSRSGNPGKFGTWNLQR